MRTRFDGDLPGFYQAELNKGKHATTKAIHQASVEIKNRWRAQVRAAGLGDRLPNVIRHEAHPARAVSFRSVGLVWTTAPHIISAHADGSTIRAADGAWLAIPLPAAGKGRYGRRMTPIEWERRNNLPLRFVYRAGRSAILVADDARLRTGTRTKGTAARKGGKRRQDGILSGSQTIPIFVLVPQVKLRKRLDLDRDVDAVVSGLDARIVANWK